MVKSEKRQNTQSELYAKFFSGLANPTRFRIIETLIEGEKTVSELIESLNTSQSQISNHLSCLKWCGFVTSRQEGKFVYYTVTDKRISEIVSMARSVVAENYEHIGSCTRM